MDNGNDMRQIEVWFNGEQRMSLAKGKAELAM
jgi:hypothetical protein